MNWMKLDYFFYNTPQLFSSKRKSGMTVLLKIKCFRKEIGCSSMIPDFKTFWASYKQGGLALMKFKRYTTMALSL